MVGLSRTLQTDDDLRHLAAYLTVGLLSMIIDFILFAVLRMTLGLPTLLANTTSYSTGIVFSYILHRRWTYGGRSRKAVGLQFVQFAGVSLAALAMNNLLVLLLAPPLGALLLVQTYGDLLAKVIATGLGTCWNYLLNNLWTFRDATMRGVHRYTEANAWRNPCESHFRKT